MFLTVLFQLKTMRSLNIISFLSDDNLSSSILHLCEYSLKQNTYCIRYIFDVIVA